MTQISTKAKAIAFAPDLPWNTFDPEQLGPTIMTHVQDHEPFFKRWAQVWYENFQFLFGNHNFKWSRKYGFAVDYDTLRDTVGSALRTNTNLARPIVESLASFMFGNLPTWTANPMDESSIKGKRHKKIVEKLLDAYMHRLLMHKEFLTAAVCYVIFGQFGGYIGWKRNAGSILEIPRYQKIKMPLYSTYMAPNIYTGGLIEVPTMMTDPMGNPMMEERWEAVMDHMGRQIIDKVFAGDVGFDVLTPFEYRRELGTYGMHKTRFVQRFRLMDYDDFLDEVKDLPGATKEFKRVRPIYSDPTIYSMAVRHFMRMQFTCPPSLEDGAGREGGLFKSSLFKYKVFVVDHFDRPHPDKWEKGRRAIVANGVCTHVTEPDYNTNKMDGWHPFIEAQWLTATPNSIAAGPMNDVIRKNKELNVKDTLIATAVRRNMGSQLLVKTGSGIDPNKLTGEPGVAHEVSDPFAARWLHDDMPIPPVLARLRELDKEDVYESTGAVEALRGQPSTGASSGYQEKQREEREEKRLTPAKNGFEYAISGAGEKMVACLKANALRLDDSVIGFLKRSGAGEFTIEDVVAFLTTPLEYGIDIAVDKSSMAIKSKATEQATLVELAGGPLAQRLAQDAKVLDEYLKRFDAEALRDSSAPHRDRATRENEVFLDMLRLGPNVEGIPRPIVVFEDDDVIHMAEHAEMFIKNFEEYRNNEAMMLAYMEHQERHRIQHKEKTGELMPGTSLETGQMMSQAVKTAKPTVQTIYMNTQLQQQQKSMQPQQPQPPQQQAPNPAAPQGNAQAPQAPRRPRAPGGGGGTIDPNAPSQSTPTAASRGGLM